MHFIFQQGIKELALSMPEILQLSPVRELTKDGTRHENAIYHITGQEALSFGQATEIISEELGRKVTYMNISEEDARKQIKDMGMVEQFRNIRAGYASQITALVEQITGRKPISFSQFVKDYVKAFK